MTKGLARVQAAVESMIVVEKIVKADNLTEGEWRVLEGVVTFLRKFKLVRIASDAKGLTIPLCDSAGRTRARIDLCTRTRCLGHCMIDVARRTGTPYAH
ncbi:hypothetical protein RvY_05695 [Ramazzottius varieornatus]|uniref:Uncharacterized protein n=1 Tax=Ramazzottius varieornatus TaxID=947166 RepID=A0A1D1V4W7_RAMVA|nr:hypothetical protein RvY_05695 [Ramazzottius varieornatus]